MHVVGNSMNDIYRRLCGKISVQGQEVAGTKELLNSGFTLLDITDNIATARTGHSLPYMSGELAWFPPAAMSSDTPKDDVVYYCFRQRHHHGGKR